MKQNRDRNIFKNNSEIEKISSPKKELLHLYSHYTKRDIEKNLDYSKLEVLYIDLKRKYEEDKINLDLCTNGYIRTIEIEKEERYKIEEELNILRSIMEENMENYNNEINKLKYNADQEKEKLQLEINCANQRIDKMNELNNIISSSNKELQNNLIMINEERESIINEFENKVRTMNLETKSILEIKEKAIEEYKSEINNMISQLNHLEMNLQNSEANWNEIFKVQKLKLENETKNTDTIQIEFDSYKEKAKISKANLKADLRKEKELTNKLNEKIGLMKLDLENKNNEILNQNNNYSSEIQSLIDENNKLKSQYEIKLKVYSSKICEI